MSAWLPDMDLNHDKQIQSLLCYRYTIGQTDVPTVISRAKESRPLSLDCSSRGNEAPTSLFVRRQAPASEPRYLGCYNLINSLT